MGLRDVSVRFLCATVAWKVTAVLSKRNLSAVSNQRPVTNFNTNPYTIFKRVSEKVMVLNVLFRYDHRLQNSEVNLGRV